MAARPAGRQIALPNQTIYINNINDKLSKDLLRRCAAGRAWHVRIAAVRPVGVRLWRGRGAADGRKCLRPGSRRGAWAHPMHPGGLRAAQTRD